jgi:hypothetical protein
MYGFCNVRVCVRVGVCVGLSMCGFCHTVCVSICCVLYCLYRVFVLFRLCIFIICFFSASVRPTATECQLY